LFDFLIISICPKVKKNLQSQNIIATVQSSIKKWALGWIVMRQLIELAIYNNILDLNEEKHYGFKGIPKARSPRRACSGAAPKKNGAAICTAQTQAKYKQFCGLRRRPGLCRNQPGAVQ
jgi:hypothetical protein